MLYRFIISGYTDTLAYVSALLAALWLFAAGRYPSALPGGLAALSPLYGLAVAAFFGALLICKHICSEGTAAALDRVNTERARLEQTVKKRDLSALELKEKIVALGAENATARDRLAAMEANSSTAQLSALRKKLRAAEDDTKSALVVLVRNLQERLHEMQEVHDPQLLFAGDVLGKEVGLVENEIKRGELTSYELCLKIVHIGENLRELKEIDLAASLERQGKQGSVADAWLHFIQVNENTDPGAVERSFKFFKVAFHPDRFPTESYKVEATRYFQHSINAHNALKRREKAAP